MVEVHVAADVAAVCDLYEGLLGADAVRRTATEQLGLLADRLADGHRRRHRGALVELRNWHPELLGRSEDEVWSAALDDRDVLDTVARDHGYGDWDAVRADRSNRAGPAFESCVDALLRGDAAVVGASLRSSPDLVRARSHWGHHATLLHYLAANGVEIYRQRVPANAPDLARLLIEHGADVEAKADMYGGRRAVLGMLLSSGHPADAGVAGDLARVLRQAGAAG